MLLLVEVRVAAVLPGLVVESGQQAAEMQWLAAVRIEVWHWYRPRRSYIGVVLRRYLSRVPFHASGTTKLRPVFFNPCLVYRKNDVLVQPHDDDRSSEIWFAVSLFTFFAAAAATFLLCHYRVRDWVLPRVFRAWWRLHARFPWLVPRLPRRYIRAMANWLNRDTQRGNHNRGANGHAWPNDDVPLDHRNSLAVLVNYLLCTALLLPTPHASHPTPRNPWPIYLTPTTRSLSNPSFLTHPPHTTTHLPVSTPYLTHLSIHTCIVHTPYLTLA
ncbi:hypothetical protein O3P69_016739 [Scylla paramamosain]|uniref:Uncharacterized protein n=1 Tax=Scylla paramamosain TaxID=85552 RepID=A0AAW0SYC7_SCYPA